MCIELQYLEALAKNSTSKPFFFFNLKNFRASKIVLFSLAHRIEQVVGQWAGRLCVVEADSWLVGLMEAVSLKPMLRFRSHRLNPACVSASGFCRMVWSSQRLFEDSICCQRPCDLSNAVNEGGGWILSGQCELRKHASWLIKKHYYSGFRQRLTCLDIWVGFLLMTILQCL